jgi:transcriptional regulator with XRE-family HTH domain
MPVRHYRKDPRTLAERQADDSVRHLFERGEILSVDANVERDAIAHVQHRYQARRETVAALGKELGVLRRAHGWTQDQVAIAMGTKKSNISRLESGNYGGLTIEYFMAIIDAFRALAAGASRLDTVPRQFVRRRKQPNSRLQRLGARAARPAR